jgi:hypothetical protein
VKCPLASPCDFCTELEQVVGWLGRRACNAQIFLCCTEVGGDVGCEKYKCCLYVRVARTSDMVKYMQQVHRISGEELTDTGSDISHNLVSYSLGEIMQKENFAGIEHFLACLRKIIRRESCNVYTFIDVCRTVCKTTFVAVGYDDCHDYEWITRMSGNQQVQCLDVRETSLKDLCCIYKEFF